MLGLGSTAGYCVKIEYPTKANCVCNDETIKVNHGSFNRWGDVFDLFFITP